ncbi:MAG: DegT/DnrJ/EryC1/StrS aminotransferase family protein [Pseudomonadota bacterium]
MMKKIAPPAPWPVFAEDEIAAVTEVLRSGKVNYWTGDLCRQFERAYAAYVDTKHAVAVANGTVALELALYALGIGPGDEVITPSRTYIASASCAVVRGAVPVVVDVDPVSQNICPAAIRAALTPRTRAIVVVHLAGWPCDMDPIMEIAREFDLKVIEDCAQAHGAMYRGMPVGSIGHAAAFSFCQDKIISTGGEGGMMTTNDDGVWERAWAYKDIGRSYDAVYRREHPPGFRWLTESFGTNWRMTEMQAAIGLLQLAKLEGWVSQRTEFAQALARLFGAIPAVRLTVPPPHIRHAYYKYYVFVQPQLLAAGWDRDRIVGALNERGVPCFTGSCSEIYLEKAFDAVPTRPRERLPVARALGETSLMFVVHPTLEAAWMEQVCGAIGEVFALASAGVRAPALTAEAGK